MASARRYEKLKLVQHLFYDARAPVVPVQNPLGGVASTDEGQLDLGAIMFPALTRDVDKQSLPGGRDRVWDGQPSGVEHLYSLFERCTGVILVREYSRNDANNQIQTAAGSLCQFEVRYRRRVKASRQYPDALGPTLVHLRSLPVELQASPV